MDLTPEQLIEDVEFREVRRGYDPKEVDAFLDRVASAMTKLHQQLTEANDRLSDAEGRLAAGSQPQEAPDAPSADTGESTEQIQRMLVLAQRTADAAVKEARDDAEALRAAAHTDAEQIVSEARAGAERETSEARDASSTEVRALDSARQKLSADVALLEQHLHTQRTGLGNTIAELQRYLDDPEMLAVAAAPQLSEVELPTTPGAIETSETPETPEPVTEAVAPAPELDEEPTDPPVTAEDLPSEPPRKVDGPPPAAPADELIDLGSLAPPLASEGQSDEAARSDSTESGPPTEAIEAVSNVPGPVDAAEDEDAFLAELRKAMTDDEPLGPRDHQTSGHLEAEHEDPRPRPRFGRRR